MKGPFILDPRKVIVILCVFPRQPSLAHYSGYSSLSGKMMLANLSVPHWKTALSKHWTEMSFQTLMILLFAYKSSFNKGLCEMQKGNQEHGRTHNTFMMRDFPKLVGTSNWKQRFQACLYRCFILRSSTEKVKKEKSW